MMRLNQDDNPNNSMPQCLHCGVEYIHFDYDISGFCTHKCKDEWHLQAANKNNSNKKK